MYKTISLDLNFMPASDRDALWKILRSNGLFKPVYFSLTPQATDKLEEQMFQVYGKLSRTSAIQYQFVNQYSSKLEIEEV